MANGRAEEILRSAPHYDVDPLTGPETAGLGRIAIIPLLHPRELGFPDVGRFVKSLGSNGAVVVVWSDVFESGVAGDRTLPEVTRCDGLVDQEFCDRLASLAPEGVPVHLWKMDTDEMNAWQEVLGRFSDWLTWEAFVDCDLRGIANLWLRAFVDFSEQVNLAAALKIQEVGLQMLMKRREQGPADDFTDMIVCFADLGQMGSLLNAIQNTGLGKVVNGELQPEGYPPDMYTRQAFSRLLVTHISGRQGQYALLPGSTYSEILAYASAVNHHKLESLLGMHRNRTRGDLSEDNIRQSAETVLAELISEVGRLGGDRSRFGRSRARPGRNNKPRGRSR